MRGRRCDHDLWDAMQGCRDSHGGGEEVVDREGGCTAGPRPDVAHVCGTNRALSTFARPQTSDMVMQCEERSLVVRQVDPWQL